MLGIFTFILFIIELIICLILNISIVYALLIGWVIFMGYGLVYGHSLKKMFYFSFRGTEKVKNIILSFILIGMITAIWRSSGTIAFIVFYGSKIISPKLFILFTFLLCSLLSTLMGTALGTSATMGVICISIARAMGINELFVGGAVLSGIYVGDRNSPLSVSALLISEITKTNIYENVKEMLLTSIIPFSLTCLLYTILGLFSKNINKTTNITLLFKENYNLNPIVIIPAILIIILTILKINMKKTMLISILCSILFSLIFQRENIISVTKYLIYGYSKNNEQINNMMKGGGIISMIKVTLIVAISSSYSGIFEGTGMLLGLKKYIKILSKKITPYGSVLVTAIVTSIIACNQSLASILTNQLCDKIMRRKKLAITMENTVVVIAGLVPWSIAMAVPFKALDVPNKAALYGFFLYLIPLWNYYIAIKNSKAKMIKIN